MIISQAKLLVSSTFWLKLIFTEFIMTHKLVVFESLAPFAYS